MSVFIEPLNKSELNEIENREKYVRLTKNSQISYITFEDLHVPRKIIKNYQYFKLSSDDNFIFWNKFSDSPDDFNLPCIEYASTFNSVAKDLNSQLYIGFLYFLTDEGQKLLNVECLEKIVEYAEIYRSHPRENLDKELIAFAIESLYRHNKICITTKSIHYSFPSILEQKKQIRICLELIFYRFQKGYWNTELIKLLNMNVYNHKIFEYLEEQCARMKVARFLCSDYFPELKKYLKNISSSEKKYLPRFSHNFRYRSDNFLESIKIDHISVFKLDNYIIKGAIELSSNWIRQRLLLNEAIFGKAVHETGEEMSKYFGETLEIRKDLVINKDESDNYNIKHTENPKFVNLIINKYLNGKSWFYHRENFTDNLKIMIQTFVALDWAYKKFDFTHYDLNLSNIILLEKSEDVLFNIGETEIKFSSKFQPVIIDFERSHYRIDGNDNGIYYEPNERYFLNIEWNESFPGHDIIKIFVDLYVKFHQYSYIKESFSKIIEKHYKMDIQMIMNLHRNSSMSIDRRPEWLEIKYESVILDLWKLLETL